MYKGGSRQCSASMALCKFPGLGQLTERIVAHTQQMKCCSYCLLELRREWLTQMCWQSPCLEGNINSIWKEAGGG